MLKLSNNTLFPGCQNRYGLNSINEADFYQFPTPAEQYAWWVRNIAATRYDYPPGKPYLDLRRIIKDKNHIILTTNTDGQFLNSGFDTEKICFPQGDLAFFQCSTPCSDEYYFPTNKRYKNCTPASTIRTLPYPPQTSPAAPVAAAP
jgi:NAD-dependent SIR2 family protein deacetylase